MARIIKPKFYGISCNHDTCGRCDEMDQKGLPLCDLDEVWCKLFQCYVDITKPVGTSLIMVYRCDDCMAGEMLAEYLYNTLGETTIKTIKGGGIQRNTY